MSRIDYLLLLVLLAVWSCDNQSASAPLADNDDDLFVFEREMLIEAVEEDTLVPADDDVETPADSREELSVVDKDEETAEPAVEEELEPIELPLVTVTRFEAVSARNVVIEWTPMADAYSVDIRRWSEEDQAWVSIRRKDGAHGRFLDLGLWPQTSYSYQVAGCSGGWCGEGQDLGSVTTHETGLPGMVVTVPYSGGAAGQNVLFGVSCPFDTGIAMSRLAGVDRYGTILWEYRRNNAGGINEVQPMPDHTVMAALAASLNHIDLDNRVIYTVPVLTVHHDMDLLPDGRWMFLTFDAVARPDLKVWLADAIAFMNPVTKLVEWSWYAKDHIPQTEYNETDIAILDWTHSNAVHFDAAKSLIYLNVRNLDRIYAISYPDGNVEWIMGDGGSFGDGLWSHSHDPSYLSDNHVLIFDNGYLRDGGELYSRVIDIKYDTVAKTAEVAWEYRESPDFYSAVFGSAQELSDGEIFITDGVNGRLLQVTRDKVKTWELKLDLGCSVYKAEPVDYGFFEDW